MSDARLMLDQINVVTANFAESLAFYRLLGLNLPEDGVFLRADVSHHVNAESEDGAHFDIDSTTFAQCGMRAGEAATISTGACW